MTSAHRAWLAAASYAFLIFILSCLPHPLPVIPGMEKYPLDKIFHVIEYGFFGWLLIRAWRTSFLWRPFKKLAAASFLTGVLYGASDEWHQSFVPERNASCRDLAADAAGLAVGIAVWAQQKEKLPKL